jgi:hypothetical protein
MQNGNVPTVMQTGSKKVGTAMPTFNITVEQETDIDPLSEDDIKDYIVAVLELYNVLVVTNIVRDY